ncbi:MAG: hypothetical protein V4677_10460 [Bacteroidota bacterium]
MKKLMLMIVVIGLGSTMTSCKKDYVCKCTKTYTGNTNSVTTEDGLYTYKDTKAKAIERCDRNNAESADLGGEYTRNCVIQ